MATPKIYDAFGEDGDLQYADGSVGAGVTIATAGNSFRAANARCAIGFSGTTFGQRFWPSGSYTQAWVSFRHWASNIEYNANSFTTKYMGLIDATGVCRIALKQVGNNVAGIASANQYTVSKISASGVVTPLFTTSSGFSTAPTVPDKVDIQFNYSTTGSLKIWINGTLQGSFSGDITTDGETELGGVYFGAASYDYLYSYSEGIVSDSDTRNMSLFTNAAKAAGTLDQWTGEVSNINAIAVDDENFDTTETSGDVQRYLADAAMPAGNYNILAKITNIRATQGGGDLTKLALAELINGNAHVTAEVPFPTAFGPAQFIQSLNPDSGAPWSQGDINSVTRETGYMAST